MNTKHSVAIALCFHFALFTLTARAQEVLINGWEFLGAPGNQASSVSTSVHGSFQPSTLARGPGLVAASNSGSFNSSSWHTDFAFDDANAAGNYVTFTITPNAGVIYSLTKLVFDFTAASTSSPDEFSLRASTDNFTSDINDLSLPFLPATATTTMFLHFEPMLQNLSGPVTFRFIGANASSTSGQFRFEGTGNDLEIFGTIAPPRTPTNYTLAASASAALIHSGGSSTITATVTNTGTGTADTLNYTALNVSASPGGGTVNGVTLPRSNAALANSNTAESGTATFTSSTNGVFALTPSVASATNGTLGGNATNAGTTAATVNVFSGSAKWVAAGAASWGVGANANWTDTATAAIHAAPGTFAGFTASDSAVFDGTSSGSLVNLDGAGPSLAVLSLTGGGYTLAQGTGGTLIMDNGGSPATINDSSGSHNITAPVLLNSNLNVIVANAADTLTVSGGVDGVGKTLTKSGAGSLMLSGVQTYATLTTNGGTTNVNSVIGNGTSAVSVTNPGSAMKFGSVSQTLSSLTIGAGATVTFTSGPAFFADHGDGKIHDLAGNLTSGDIVPEPGTLCLLLLGAVGVLNRRR